MCQIKKHFRHCTSKYTNNPKQQFMRNRNLINKKLENIENKLEVLRWQVTNSQSAQDFVKVIEEGKNTIQELKNLIENEPMSPEEMR